MYISELELHGFKSFAQKTRVKFDQGVTAIVGPNGCGKSNIVDALRWVLGEQRPSLLRSGAMNDVVFNGTAKRKPLGMAEVSLTLFNDKGVLPTEYHEVKVTRRLYRSGQSEYQLNETNCRLRDIMDLFMDTGMGADAYSVIELKMVEEILSDRNSERRRLFEEAAGVTRYKEKRRQTLRKLAETMGDLQRVEDLIVEVRRNTRSLQLQSERAEKAKGFREELEQLDQRYSLHEFRQVQEELEPIAARIAKLEADKETVSAELSAGESREEAARQQLLEAEQEVAGAREAVERTDRQLQDARTQIRISGERVDAEQNVIAQTRRELEQNRQDMEDLGRIRETSEQELETLFGEIEQAEQAVEQARQSFRGVQESHASARKEMLEAEFALSRKESELRELQTDRVRLESKMENSADDLERSIDRIGRLEQDLEKTRAELQAAETRQGETETALREAETRHEQARAELTEKGRVREEKRERVREARSRLEALGSELRVLRDLAGSREDFPEAVSFLKDRHASSFSRLDLLSDLLRTDEELAPAVDAALGMAMHALVVDSMKEAQTAMELLRTHRKGRARFIPLAELSSGAQAVDGSLAEQVRCDPQIRPLVDQLLGGVVLVESLEHADDAWVEGTRLAVTRDGQLVVKGGYVEGGGAGRSGIRLSLKDRMESLEKAGKEAEDELERSQAALQAVVEQLERLPVDDLRKAAAEAARTHSEAIQSVQRLQTSIGLQQKNAGELQARISQIQSRDDSVREKLVEIQPRQEELAATIDADRKTFQTLKDRLQGLDEERSVQQNRFNNAQLRFQKLRSRQEQVSRELDRAREGAATIGKRVETRTASIAESESRIEGHKEEIARNEARVATLVKEMEQAHEALGRRQEQASARRGEINALEKELRELRSRKESNMELLHLQQLTRDKKEMQAKTVSDHVWDTYGLLMNQLKVEIPEDFDAAEARARISTLRQKLARIGDVNPLAIEEYREEKERLDFMEGQIKDLKEAEQSLRQAIEEINTTALQRFDETFEKIRTNFRAVFATLFKESDTCDLLLDREAEDPLDAKIEIRANPSGKRPSGISQLSGGEKTLTAIALLFAIYLVKPSPFCVLDEVDAPLDDANVGRFCQMIQSFSEQTQFILITHNKKTMASAEMMYGVTMAEAGVSRLVGVRFDQADELGI